MASPAPVTIYEDRDPKNTAVKAARGYLGLKRIASGNEVWLLQSTGATGRVALSTATSAPAGALYPEQAAATGRFQVATSEGSWQALDLNTGRFAVNDGSAVVSVSTSVWGIRTRATEADGRFVQTAATDVTVMGIAPGSATVGKIALLKGRMIMVTVLPNATA